MFVRKLTCLVVTLALVACADAGDETQDGLDTTATTATTAPAAAPAATPSTTGMLDPNTASAEQLAAIPGLNDSIAAAIVNGRPHNDMRSVNRVLSDLTEQQRDSVYTRLWRPINLNTATREEMELIPGVGPRMRGEFEEYRPWTSLEQFRREIGKYVDADEVARLERYVMIPTAAQ